MLRLARNIFRRTPAVASRPAVALHELLGRPAISLDTPEMQRFLAGKRVMVTGAGGSIGSEICRQAMRFCPDRMILLERAEGALFEIDRELRQRWIGSDLRPVVADICDLERINAVFESERPQVVFHCAAHKHVPMMEANPCEAVRNNVLGTKTVADAAAAFDVQAFVMVSTDKAVNPTSVMGATKRVAELYVQALGERSRGGESGTGEPGGEKLSVESRESGAERGQPEALSRSLLPIRKSQLAPQIPQPTTHNPQPPTNNRATRFTAVRFGNVLGSSGSVVPIFQRQIEAGGPVTVTDPEMTRYFMTIPEASQLVMQAGAIGKGGEIFVLDMGQPVRILDLAREMISRAGLRVGDQIDIQFTGIRPGEKLYEELSCQDEQIVPTSHDKIHIWQLPPANPAQVDRMIDLLRSVVYRTADDAVAALRRCVPEYRSADQQQQSINHDSAVLSRAA